MKYPVLIGKIGSEMSRLLKREDYEKLMRAKSVPEIAEYLRNKTYGDFIPDTEDIHRRDLEAAVQRRFYRTLDEFEKYVTFPERTLVRHVMMRCEIETLKKVLRIFTAGEEFDPRFLVCDPGFDPDDLLSSRTVEELISKLSRKPYYSILNSTLREGVKIGRLENALDLWYFTKLLKIATSSGLRSVVKFLKKQADLMNIVWVYRGRFLFGFEPGKILNTVLPFGYHIRGGILNKLASSKDEEEFFEALAGTPYGDIIPGKDTKVSREFVLERRLIHSLYREARKLIRNYSNGFDVLVGYIHLLEYEIKNITTVIETVRYGLSVEVGGEYLIGG